MGKLSCLGPGPELERLGYLVRAAPSWGDVEAQTDIADRVDDGTVTVADLILVVEAYRAEARQRYPRTATKCIEWGLADEIAAYRSKHFPETPL